MSHKKVKVTQGFPKITSVLIRGLGPLAAVVDVELDGEGGEVTGTGPSEVMFSVTSDHFLKLTSKQRGACRDESVVDFEDILPKGHEVINAGQTGKTTFCIVIGKVGREFTTLFPKPKKGAGR